LRNDAPEPVTRRVSLPAPREEVWRALVTPELLSSWLGEVTELDARAGGSVIVREPDGATRRGLVERVEPGRTLVFRWRRLAGAGRSLEVGEATRVEFELEDEGAGTRLTVTEQPAPLVAAGATP
jgi:uncharacterized protein YndB with AHSA1/START domain